MQTLPHLHHHHGEQGHGGAHPAGQPAAGRLQLHRPELQPRAAADRSGGRPERREELGAGELRGQVILCVNNTLRVKSVKYLFYSLRFSSNY